MPKVDIRQLASDIKLYYLLPGMDTNGHFLERDHHLVDSDGDAEGGSRNATIACPKPDGICHNTLDVGALGAIASYGNSQISVTVRGTLETAHLL